MVFFILNTLLLLLISINVLFFGDGKLLQDQRLTKTNIIKFDALDAGKYLRVSGLMGQVKIDLIKQVNLK